MKIRVWLIAAAFALFIGLLTGCGGGSSKVSTASRTLVPVTVTMQFPTSGRGTGRALSSAAQSVSLEVFNGTVRVARVGLTAASPTVTLQLPPAALTFYANAYPDATAPDYVTSPTTGLPAAPANNPSLARGVTTQEVPIANGQPLVFSGYSNVALLVPNFPALPSSNPAPAAQPYQTVPLDNTTGGVAGTLSLANLMSARDAQGNVLLLPDGDLTWQVETADPLAAQKASINGLTLTLLGTGQVNLIATDTRVNGTAGQQQITGVFPLLITPAANTTTLTANVTQIPLYARSVTLTVSQEAFNGSAANGANQPPAPVTVTTTTFIPASPATTQNATLTVSNFKKSGRTLTLRADAWSNTDGTGALVGTLTVTGQAVTGSPFAMALTNNVVSFKLTPVSTFVGGDPLHPQIYQTATVPITIPPTPPSFTTPTSVTLQATLIVKDSNGNSVDTGQAVHDPTTLQWDRDIIAAATVSQSGVVTSLGPTAPVVNITARDKTTPAPPAAGNIYGTLPIQILSNAGSANFTVN